MFASHELLKNVLFKSALLPLFVLEYGFEQLFIGFNVPFFTLLALCFKNLFSSFSGVMFAQFSFIRLDSSLRYSSLWCLPSIPFGCSFSLCHFFITLERVCAVSSAVFLIHPTS